MPVLGVYIYPNFFPSLATQSNRSTTMASETTTEETTKKLEKMNISISIWPPTQRTRDTVINRLIETLTAPSILSKRYGSLPPEEASSAARAIEDEAFSIASSAVSPSDKFDDDDGIEILQIYSNEISKRMLEAVKARADAGSAAPADVLASAPAPAEEEEEVKTEPVTVSTAETSEET